MTYFADGVQDFHIVKEEVCDYDIFKRNIVIQEMCSIDDITFYKEVFCKMEGTSVFND